MFECVELVCEGHITPRLRILLLHRKSKRFEERLGLFFWDKEKRGKTSIRWDITH